MENTTDLLIIGGGINGVAIANDAAGRGLSVILCEQNDLAGATSSFSTKLIHGGLRYLEQYDFKLVHQSLRERSILFNNAPFLIEPIQFVLPYATYLRPQWMIRLGLFLYDHLAWHNSFARSGKLNLQQCAQGIPLGEQFSVGFHYTDCRTDDARLVILNALAAQEHGAKILTRTKCQKVQRLDNHWQAVLQDGANQTFTVQAKAIVNAAGPWVNQILQNILQITPTQNVRLVQGSHIIIPQLYTGDHAYILQNQDQRVVFAIPYQQCFTLIGTTDLPYQGEDPSQARITSAEIEYLIKTINGYFKKQITIKDIIWSYAGVRTLLDNTNLAESAKLTREYHLELKDFATKQTPLLSVYGGKLTTHRKLAERALKLLKPYFPHMGPAWTAEKSMPGGDIPSIANLIASKQNQFPWLPKEILLRYIKTYGSRLDLIVEDCKNLSDLGEHFGAGLFEKEIQYLTDYEWAQTVEDILWRRTKLGLLLTNKQVEKMSFKLRKKEINVN